MNENARWVRVALRLVRVRVTVSKVRLLTKRWVRGGSGLDSSLGLDQGSDSDQICCSNDSEHGGVVPW